MGGTPYWMILPVVVGWLAARHASSPTASDRSRRAVPGLTVVAFLLGLVWSVAIIPASILLTGVGVYIILHRDVTESGAGAESQQLPRAGDHPRERGSQ